MGKLGVHDIRALAKRIISDNPGGIRYSKLVQEIAAQSPETPQNTIHGAVWNLDTIFPNEIIKPVRGLFRSASAAATGDAVVAPPETQVTATGQRVRESDFYESFAEWLKNDLDEVTDVAPLGGAGLRTKWGTPDVIGVYKPLASNLIKFPVEIVSAEVKIDPQAPVVAFGQAVAYRLFSAKTFIAMPTTMAEEDESRLEALCMLFGVGLVLFDVDPKAPNFSIRVRAQRFSPDMFYVNEFADRLRQLDAETFEKLFR